MKLQNSFKEIMVLAATGVFLLAIQPESGPLRKPGSLSRGALNVSHNMLLINLSSRSALVCVPAKSGSTSFYNWLYRQMAGRPWPHKGSPWIQNTTSERWTSLRGSAVRIKDVPSRWRRALLSRADMRRFAMHRHPIERAVSAYYSKVACGHGDKEDHAGVVAQLIKHAPKAATRLGPKSDPHGAVPCLASLDWARLLAEAAESSVAERRLINAHFLPQSDACAFDELGYDVLVPIADNEAGLAALAQHLGFPPATLGHKHSTTATRKRLPPSASSAPSSAFELDSDTLTVLRRIYAHDLKLLRDATV